MPPPSTPTTNNQNNNNHENQSDNNSNLNESNIPQSSNQSQSQSIPHAPVDPADLTTQYAVAYERHRLRRRSDPRWSLRSSAGYPVVPFYLNQPTNINESTSSVNATSSNSNTNPSNRYNLNRSDDVRYGGRSTTDIDNDDINPTTTRNTNNNPDLIDFHNSYPYFHNSHPYYTRVAEPSDAIGMEFDQQSLMNVPSSSANELSRLHSSIRGLGIRELQQRQQELHQRQLIQLEQTDRDIRNGLLDHETEVAYSSDEAWLDAADSDMDDEDEDDDDDDDDDVDDDDEDDEDDVDEDEDDEDEFREFGGEEFDNMVDAVMTDSYLAESDGPDPYGIDIERMLLNGNDNYYGPRSLLLPTLHPAPPPLQDFQDALEGLSDEEFNEVERELQRRQRLRQSGDLVDRFQRQTQIRSDVNNNPETNNSIPRRPTIRRNQTRPFLAPGITRSSDAQFNRLLLSSARQSYLNPNPNPRYSINDVSYRASASSSSSAAASGSGESARSRDEIRPIPLRRQNAIRLRSANPYFDELSKSVVINDSRVFDKKDKSDNKSITNNDNDNNNKDNDNNDSKDNIEEDDEKTDCSWKSEINLEARKLHRDMTDYLIRSKNLKSFRNRGGKSLLFPLSEFEPNYAYFFLPSSHSLRNEGATYNLELDMDVYLKRRRLDLLWLKLAEDCKPEPRFNACVSYGKRKFPKPLIPNEGGVLKRQKIDHNGSDGEEVEFLNDDLPKKVKSKIYNPSMKSKKGHKKTHLLLSREDKEKIMNVQFSSYFQSGVRYRILLDHYKPSITECDLVFSNIDYEQNSIQGCFQFQDFNPMSNDPYSSLRKQLEMFAKYFCGIEKDFYWNNFIKSDNIRRKLNILDKLLKDKNVHQSIANNCQVQKLISIPVEGEIIDFKTHDLRFLPSLKLPDNKSYANRHSRQSSQSPANKLKSSRARVQVLEWMKLEPFQQFKQSCLLSYLQLVRRNLIHFSNLNIPVVDQGDARYLLDSFENNMNEIKEDFAYIKHQLSNSKGLLPGKTSTSSSAPPTPPIAVSGQMSRARAALPPPPPSKLKNSDDWEKTLARKLCESITDDDSISLLNVQLNYVLFTLKVDVSKYLDICINFFLENCHDDKKSYISKYKMVHDKILKDESKEKVVDDNKFATLLCSINRKSGLLEIHNTLPYLHYKDINPKHSSQVLSRVMGIGSSGRVQSDFEMFSLADREGLPRSFGDLPKDLNHHLPAKSSKLTGTLKRDYSSHEVGSGHSSFQMV